MIVWVAEEIVGGHGGEMTLHRSREGAEAAVCARLRNQGVTLFAPRVEDGVTVVESFSGHVVGRVSRQEVLA